MGNITPEQLEIIRQRYEAGEKQTKLAQEYGVRQSSLSELLSGRRGGRRAARLTEEQKQALVAESAGGASIDVLAERYGQTPRGVSRILRAHGWERGGPEITVYPILSDGSPGKVWKDAFEIRWNKRTGQGVVRCTPGYRSNHSEPKMLRNGMVRLRVHGPDPGDTTTYVQHTFPLDDLIRAARREQQLIAAEGKPWFTYFMLRKGVFTPATTKGGIAAAGEGALVEKVKIGATKGQAEDRVAADTFHPEPLRIVCVMDGWDRDRWHEMFASCRCRNSGQGNEWFEAVGDLRKFLADNDGKRADKEPPS